MALLPRLLFRPLVALPVAARLASSPSTPGLAQELNRALHGQIKVHDYQAALDTIKQMEAHKITPDHVSYSRLLRRS